MIAIDFNPSEEKLRQFAWFAPVGFGVIGLIVALKLGAFSGAASMTPSVVLWVIGGLVCLLGIIRAAAVKPLYLLMSVVTFPIGLVVGSVILFFLYFGLFTPLALIFRAMGRDVLDRDFDNPRESYWHKPKAAKSIANYYRQF